MCGGGGGEEKRRWTFYGRLDETAHDVILIEKARTLDFFQQLERKDKHGLLLY